ncbi:TetR/AcrR family transcriptional regulator [Spiractinospora alimapuensis]|uniref:TetR/AcrR family transcriptional regulator n=1 Tax=Spiractinospora alimapuensis TaxID=2820884 RepID=UPI001F409656|nr:TetR/AcrR family transcriptional regulator [Spiractinospora alimapuensis]QVQ54028.1 TetR/AcrR family transcriptional regulator [Spiractinospora alimapuensis]
MATPSDTRPRGTRLPRTARRRQLLAAAQEVFVARGYHAAAMDEIAESAGVSKPVLYQHFPGKLDLYLALLEEHSEALVQTQRAALESTEDNRQRVAASFQAYFDFVAGEGKAYRLVFESDLGNLPQVREKVDETTDQCVRLIGEVIRQDTSISESEANLLSIGLLGMAQTSARYWLNHYGTIPKEDAGQLIARLAWRGLSGWDLTRA